MMLNKLIIGTANFGQVYGIANKKKLSEKQISDILYCAQKNKIWGLDTAREYGKAEKIIGKYIKNSNFSVITKLANKRYLIEDDVINEVQASLIHLNIKRIEILLIHSFENYKKDKKIIMKGIYSLIKRGSIKKWGVSVYHTEEVKKVLKDEYTDFVVEFPVNLFDRRFLSFELLKLLKDKGCLLIARSIFLQGLFTLKLKDLKGNFITVKSQVEYLQQLSKIYNIPVPAIALLFVMSQKHIDKVIIGVDSIGQLNENILSFRYMDKFKKIANKLDKLKINDKNIILPYNWKLTINLLNL